MCIIDLLSGGRRGSWVWG